MNVTNVAALELSFFPAEIMLALLIVEGRTVPYIVVHFCVICSLWRVVSLTIIPHLLFYIHANIVKWSEFGFPLLIFCYFFQIDCVDRPTNVKDYLLVIEFIYQFCILKRFLITTEKIVKNAKPIHSPIDAFHLLKRWVDDWQKCFDNALCSECTIDEPEIGKEILILSLIKYTQTFIF